MDILPCSSVGPRANRAEIARIWANLTPWQRAAMSHLFRLHVVSEICSIRRASRKASAGNECSAARY